MLQADGKQPEDKFCTAK